jgi:hypothetical protein
MSVLLLTRSSAMRMRGRTLVCSGLAVCEYLLKLIGDGYEIGCCGRVRVLVAVG